VTRPRLLDLFCGAGGAAVGYHRAGFDIVGIDIAPQPNYPFEFIQADALKVLPIIGCFDVIHASPPCKAHTKTGWAYHFDYHANHDDLLTPTRVLLQLCRTPWVIENVPGAPMRVDVALCGSEFGLGVRRHRWFELSWPHFTLMPPCDHSKRVVSPHGNPNRFKGTRQQWAEAMGIDWMTAPELAQAIPPAYTEWIGTQLLAHLEAAA
jgi:DNA (cytosine-5)-methyltransferase 1